MLPYLAMGSCSALEDAAVLGDLLGQIRSKKDVPEALRVYEKLRKSRGEAIVEETFKQVGSAFSGSLLNSLMWGFHRDMTSTCLMARNRRSAIHCFCPN